MHQGMDWGAAVDRSWGGILNQLRRLLKSRAHQGFCGRLAAEVSKPGILAQAASACYSFWMVRATAIYLANIYGLGIDRALQLS